MLANSERVYGAAIGAFELLYEVEESAIARLRAAGKQLEELARFDESFKESLAQLESARITVEDVATTLRDFADGMDASPERLAEVEDRLAALDKLRRKYGKTIDDVLGLSAGESPASSTRSRTKTSFWPGCARSWRKRPRNIWTEARAFSKQRYETARKLEKTVEGEINDLAMKARFKIEVSGSDEEANWSATGFDHVAYLISTNPGEPLGPIEQIASGGELSRVMLALKASVEAGRLRSKGSDTQRSLVFDEIDSGIGGRAADAVGRKLKALSRSKQVLCMTHLPQIASFADQHFLIEKHESAGRTKTTVRPLSAEERRSEIARMLSGAKITEASLQNAEQMLRANV